MSDLVRLCVACPPGEARPAVGACPRCGRPLCDQHRIRESSPPSRCDHCEADFRLQVNSGREIGLTAVLAGGPIAVGTALIAAGHGAAGAATMLFGPLAGIALRIFQRRHGAMRRRFLAERADELPLARVVRRSPPE